MDYFKREIGIRITIIKNCWARIWLTLVISNLHWDPFLQFYRWGNISAKQLLKRTRIQIQIFMIPKFKIILLQKNKLIKSHFANSSTLKYLLINLHMNGKQKGMMWAKGRASSSRSLLRDDQPCASTYLPFLWLTVEPPSCNWPCDEVTVTEWEQWYCGLFPDHNPS